MAAKFCLVWVAETVCMDQVYQKMYILSKMFKLDNILLAKYRSQEESVLPVVQPAVSMLFCLPSGILRFGNHATRILKKLSNTSVYELSCVW